MFLAGARRRKSGISYQNTLILHGHMWSGCKLIGFDGVNVFLFFSFRKHLVEINYWHKICTNDQRTSFISAITMQTINIAMISLLNFKPVVTDRIADSISGRHFSACLFASSFFFFFLFNYISKMIKISIEMHRPDFNWLITTRSIRS